VGVPSASKKYLAKEWFSTPHPGSLSLADPPRKGEG
jgi:hypothetical protein